MPQEVSQLVNCGIFDQSEPGTGGLWAAPVSAGFIGQLVKVYEATGNPSEKTPAFQLGQVVVIEIIAFVDRLLPTGNLDAQEESHSFRPRCTPLPSLRAVAGDERTDCPSAQGGEQQGQPASGGAAHAMKIARLTRQRGHPARVSSRMWCQGCVTSLGG
jgi:hypothetical protein